MKQTRCIPVALIFVSVLILGLTPKAHCMDEVGFTISRMVVSENVADREPVGEAAIFSQATEKVYCFLEATDVEWDMDIVFAWYHEGRELAKVTLPLKQGPRWRTHTSKLLLGQKGAWTVELQESSGIVLNTVVFTVE